MSRNIVMRGSEEFAVSEQDPYNDSFPDVCTESDDKILPMISGRLFSNTEYQYNRKLHRFVNNYINTRLGSRDVNAELPSVVYIQQLTEIESDRAELFGFVEACLGSDPDFPRIFLSSRLLTGANLSDLEDWMRRRTSIGFPFQAAFMKAVMASTFFDPQSSDINYTDVHKIWQIIQNERNILLVGPKARTGAIIDLCEHADSITSNPPFIIVLSARTVPEGVTEVVNPPERSVNFESVADFSRFSSLERIIDYRRYPKAVVYRTDDEPEQAASYLMGLANAEWFGHSTYQGRQLALVGLDFSKLTLPIAIGKHLEMVNNTPFLNVQPMVRTNIPKRYSLGREDALTWTHLLPTGLNIQMTQRDLERSITSAIQNAYISGSGSARDILESVRARAGITSYYYKDIRSAVNCNYLRTIRDPAQESGLAAEKGMLDLFLPDALGSEIRLTAFKVKKERLDIINYALVRWPQSIAADAETLGLLIKGNPEVRSAFNVAEVTYDRDSKLTDLVIVPNDDQYAMWVASHYDEAYLYPEDEVEEPAPSAARDRRSSRERATVSGSRSRPSRGKQTSSTTSESSSLSPSTSSTESMRSPSTSESSSRSSTSSTESMRSPSSSRSSSRSRGLQARSSSRSSDLRYGSLSDLSEFDI